MPFTFKSISSMEKCFADESISSKKERKVLSVLRNERAEFQLAYEAKDFGWHSKTATLTIESDIKEFIKVSRIEQVPVALAVSAEADPTGYLRTEPGLFPDLLIPMDDQYKLIFSAKELRSLYVSVENVNGLPCGEHKIVFSAYEDQTLLCSTEMTLNVIDAFLPESELIHTQWFHCDCLSQYYDAPVFSERHWDIIKKFMDEAVYAGVNMILTPVFTPPLDTAIGGERRTVQLTDVKVTDNGYEFGFDRLDKWIKMAKEAGIKYFEISHLFTQWGCAYAPKVIADVNGESKQIFGWDTNALSDDYRVFVRAFLKALVKHLKELGIDRDCYYHISDEPSLEHFDAHNKAKDMVIDIIGEYNMIDALSDYDFYARGAVRKPIPSTDHIEHFLENNVKGLWTYYCLGQHSKVSNRFIALPGQRTRILGIQLFKYDIEGFLHWSFNFYNCQFSNYGINPFIDTCGEYFAPGGDTFFIYPGPNGKPYRSLHGVLFTQALTDLRALKKLSSLVGKEKVMEIINEDTENEITFAEYPSDMDYIHTLRDKINSAIEKAVKG